MVAGYRVLYTSATGSAQPQRLRASPPRQDQNHRAGGSELPGFAPNPRDKGSRAIRVSGHSSPLLLRSLVGALGFVFQHGELDFLLYVINAVNDHAHTVADGISLLAARADDLARVFVVGVNVVGE